MSISKHSRIPLGRLALHALAAAFITAGTLGCEDTLVGSTPEDGPVDLVALAGETTGTVELDWTFTGTADEIKVYRATIQFSDVIDATADVADDATDETTSAATAPALVPAQASAIVEEIGTATGNSFADTAVSDGVQYFYRVLAVNVNGKGDNALSNIAVYAPGAALDSDGDGIPDDIELLIGTDPNKADTDGDGIDDDVELMNGTDPKVDSTNTDIDGDGVSDVDEINAGTDPLNPDSDGDGFSDGEEKAGKTDPLDESDKPSTHCLPLLNGATKVTTITADAGLWASTTGDGLEYEEYCLVPNGDNYDLYTASHNRSAPLLSGLTQIISEVGDDDEHDVELDKAIQYFGVAYATVTMNTNGTLNFDSDYGTGRNQVSANDFDNYRVIAPYNDDLGGYVEAYESSAKAVFDFRLSYYDNVGAPARYTITYLYDTKEYIVEFFEISGVEEDSDFGCHIVGIFNGSEDPDGMDFMSGTDNENCPD